MKSNALVSLIKEVVKNEVKRQVKEEVIKLIKSGDITLNGYKKTEKTSKSKPSLSEAYQRPSTIKPKQTVREITKNPMLNEILNQTEPFTSAHRVEAGPVLGATGASILDALQPSVSMNDDWETMDFRGAGIPQQPMPTPETDNPGVDALTKALTRDYRELVKRFK